MSLLKGEMGSHLILYGSFVLPFGRMLSAYHARPDHSGPHPAVIVAHGAGGLTPHVRSVCRTLARFGFSTICPDLYRGVPGGGSDSFSAIPHGRLAADLGDVVETIEAPGTEWADREGLSVMGLGDGGRPVLALASALDLAGAVLVSTPIDGGDPSVRDLLMAAPFPVLGLYGAADDAVPVADVRAVGAAAAAVEMVIYGEAAGDFFEDDSPGYDFAAAGDAMERAARFLAGAAAVRGAPARS